MCRIKPIVMLKKLTTSVGKLSLEAGPRHPQSDKRAAVLAFLADPERSRLSNREIARQIGCGATLVNELRKVHARGSEALPPPGMHACTPKPDRAPRRLPRKAFEAPPLNSLHCWHDATPSERTKFVDAVGLWNLFNAAPEDHRAAFVARQVRFLSKAEVLESTGRTYPTIWAWGRADKFPRARQLGNRPMWIESEVDQWIQALPIRKLKGDGEPAETRRRRPLAAKSSPGRVRLPGRQRARQGEDGA
jgi:predicted DNA-binding transcriptional regulator AlpA